MSAQVPSACAATKPGRPGRQSRTRLHLFLSLPQDGEIRELCFHEIILREDSAERVSRKTDQPFSDDCDRAFFAGMMAQATEPWNPLKP